MKKTNKFVATLMSVAMVFTNGIFSPIITANAYNENENITAPKKILEMLDNYISDNKLACTACGGMYKDEIYYIMLSYNENEQDIQNRIEEFIAQNNIDSKHIVFFKNKNDMAADKITDPQIIHDTLDEIIAQNNIPAKTVLDDKLSIVGITWVYEVDDSNITCITNEKIELLYSCIFEKNISPTLVRVVSDDSKTISKKSCDANCDLEVNMADAVLIMQYISNPDKYGENGTDKNHITEQGKKNADIAGENDGVTNADALAIQKKLLKLD